MIESFLCMGLQTLIWWITDKLFWLYTKSSFLNCYHGQTTSFFSTANTRNFFEHLNMLAIRQISESYSQAIRILISHRISPARSFSRNKNTKDTRVIWCLLSRLHCRGAINICVSVQTYSYRPVEDVYLAFGAVFISVLDFPHRRDTYISYAQL